jgi:hypothetical protein
MFASKFNETISSVHLNISLHLFKQNIMKLIFSILLLTEVSLFMAGSVEGDTLKISSKDDEIFLPKHGVYLNTFGLFGKFRIRYEYQPIASRSYQIGLCTHYILNLDYGTNVFFEYRQYPMPTQRHLTAQRAGVRVENAPVDRGV